MTETAYKKLELIGSSSQSIEDAVQQALSKAARTLHNLRWFELIETRGQVDERGQVGQWQVTLKVGFRLDE